MRSSCVGKLSSMEKQMHCSTFLLYSSRGRPGLRQALLSRFLTGSTNWWPFSRTIVSGSWRELNGKKRDTRGRTVDVFKVAAQRLPAEGVYAAQGDRILKQIQAGGAYQALCHGGGLAGCCWDRGHVCWRRAAQLVDYWHELTAALSVFSLIPPWLLMETVALIQHRCWIDRLHLQAQALSSSLRVL